MKLLIPLIMALFGLAAGAGAGWYLRPPPPDESASETVQEEDARNVAARAADESRSGDHETLRLTNQFMVPLVRDDRVYAIVVIGLALELTQGHDITLARHEARLRAAFLQALFDHANMGGFEGVFTSGEVLLGLRGQLRAIAREQLGASLRDVLITDLIRQEA